MGNVTTTRLDRPTPTTGRERPRLGAHTPGPLGGLLRGARSVAEALATPLVPADYLDLVDPMRTSADLRGRIVEVRPETDDAATVVIRPGRGWLGHVPGQYVRIGVDVDGVRHWRAYSLTHRADGFDGRAHFVRTQAEVIERLAKKGVI